jgi:hypothetical protein
MSRGSPGARTALFGTVLSAAVLFASCGPSAPRRTLAVGDDAITAASFNFPESVILAEIYAQALEAGGFDVDRQLDLGTRELVEPALERGLVEFVPEYSGSALTFVTKGEVAATADEATTHRDLTTALHERGLVALEQARTQDKNGMVATAETATRFEKPLSLRPRFALDRFDVFPGGCVTYRFEFVTGAPPALVFEVNEALGFVPRALGVQLLREEIGLELCGAGARPCPG